MEEGRHLRAGDSMCVKMLLEILNDGSFELVTSKNVAIVDTLSREADSSQKSQLLTSKRDLLTVNVSHFHSEFHYKLVINVGTGWGW